MGYGILLDREAGEGELRFAVELAQLAGFCSMTLPVTPVIHSPGEAAPGTSYLCASGDVTGQGIISAPPGGDPAGAWLKAYERCRPRFSNEAEAPEGYVSATDNRMAPPSPPPGGGLERLFSAGWALSDEDGDDLPDRLRLRFCFPNGIDAPLCEAACCLAMRFGCETTSIRWPLVTDEYDGDLVVFTGSGHEPELRLERDGERRLVIVEGSGGELAAFMREFALGFSAPHGGYDLSDAARHISDAIGGKNRDGDAAYIASARPAKAVTGAGSDTGRLRGRFPYCEVHAVNEPVPAFEREYAPEPETDRARSLLERVAELIRPGDHVELSGALWQSEEARRELEREFADRVREKGAKCSARVICAYKQGQSWFEEVFAPRAGAAGAASVQLTYDAGSASGIIYNESGLTLSDAPEKPPRYLRELYPADELAAEIMGISCESITFRGVCDPENTYKAEAFDANGRPVCSMTYSVRSHARPACDAMPELGTALVPTGYIHVSVNGETVLDERIRTDAEALWDIFQSETLPMLLERTRSGEAPFWHCAEIEAALGGVERELGSRCDHISSGETLEDSLNQMAKACLMYAGRALGRDFSCAGLVLPLITTRDGAPRFAVRIYDRYASGTSCIKREVHTECTRVTYTDGRLCLHFDTDASADCAGMVRELAALTGEGFTELAGLLSGYGGIVLRCAGEEYSCRIPELPEPAPADIRDIDLMPGELIGYSDCERIISELKRVPGLSVWRAAVTVQGRNVWAIEPSWPAESGYVSRVKRLAHLPTLYVNGRHHANEVSATNATFAFLREVLTSPKYSDICRRVNIVVVPMENADGAALHYELQKAHPNRQHQCCYTNSLGGDLMPAYFDPAPLTTEALAFTRIAERYLPDAFIDLHGVPHHEVECVFDAPGGYRGLWLPRALLCAFYYHVDDERFASNGVLSEAWKSHVNNAMQALPGFADMNDQLESRFMKYSWEGIDELYACERTGAMLNYWIPSKYNERHPYPSISRPWTFSVMFTAEAADETAHSHWLEACAGAHLQHTLAGLDFITASRCVMRESVSREPGTACIRLSRIRPVLPPEVK